MQNPVIEIVTFRLAEGVSDAQFLETVPASTEFITAMPGFIARRLSKNEDGTWLEHIEWQSIEQAVAASEAFMKEERLKPMMNAIDGASAKMNHNQLLISVG